ncbi:copper amine oxidase N-terminal domain-containing protein [Paenibacillus xylanilyticus]|uniref:Copper amine oxidase N-terminal domain-containing protein n=1 Tax=Paenibacillus xylanilyticus TaxID=248903 RepID=A0A7Y6BZL3_9BACL|nr:copper amine oxidase N-terminal domain-containing protein [Paenibacillus xylanilyticus]NUU77832.1 copper amine oxidase N-terminal domain-containing protein [Paenibacillus xylanilyticus]
MGHAKTTTRKNGGVKQNFGAKWLRMTLMLCIGVIVSALLAGHSPASAASSTSSSIISMLDRNNYILDNGTVWSKGATSGVWTQSPNLIGISKGDSHSLYGWTADGQVYRWDVDNAQKPEVNQYNGVVKVYGRGLILLQDGTLHQDGKQIKGLESIIDVGPYPADGYYSYGTLSASGDVYYADYRNIVRKVGSVENGKAIATNSAYAAVLKNDGSVVIVNMMYEEDQVEVASDVQSMIWLGNTHKLLTVKNDGTVWSYDRTAKYKSEQLPGLTNVNRLEYSFELGELYALLQDGTWGVYNEGQLKSLQAPSLTKVTLTASAKEAVLGDTVTLSVQQTYSNGFKIKRQPIPTEIILEQPQVAKIQGDGTLKVTGMGTTKVTFTMENLTSSIQLDAGAEQKLTGATLLNGTIYLPVQSVFKTLGAKVDVKGSSFIIQLGDDKITLQKGSTTARFNNQELKLKGKVQTIEGQTVFPANLLSQTSGIKVRWDAELRQAEVLVGKSAILIESKDTAALIKKKELGSLSRLIGKSYWINEYTELGQRFSKVTVTDIEIDKYDSGDKSYSVVFRNAKGKTVAAYAGGTASRVTEMLSDSDQFFTYDPYQKYKWSQSTWKKIIAGEVALGMTTKQAGLAWGDPTSITQEMSSKGKIEVWVYAGPNILRVLSFVGGKLISIY